MNKRTFRILLIAGWALFAAAAAAQFLTRSYLPEQLRSFLASERREVLAEGFSPGAVAAALILVFSVATQVGLFLLKRWARACYAAVLALDYVYLFVFGRPYVLSATGYALVNMNAALAGFLLALMYFSPFKALFERPRA
jgi:hypothetical protein